MDDKLPIEVTTEDAVAPVIKISDGTVTVTLSKEDTDELVKITARTFRFPAQQVQAMVNEAVAKRAPRAGATGTDAAPATLKRGPRSAAA